MTAAAEPRLAQGFVAYGLDSPAANALEVTHPDGLGFIRRDDLNLVIWRREDIPDLTPLLDITPDSRAVPPGDPAPPLRAETLGRDIMDFLAARYRNDTPAVMRLAVDMFELSALLMQVSGESAVRPRFERIAHDGCRFFHVDRLRLRLLCSYTGRGSQWLPDDLVNRECLGKGAKAAVLRRRDAIRTLPRGAVALLKGDSWPGNEGRAIVHRSPPAGRHDRLLLTLDLT